MVGLYVIQIILTDDNPMPMSDVYYFYISVISDVSLKTLS